MGCSSSQSLAFVEFAQTPDYKRYKKDFDLLKLDTGDIRKLYVVYDLILSAGSITISLAELLAHVDLPRTSYTEKLFSLLNLNNQAGEMDFHAFVIFVWNYCTLTPVNMDMFLFDLYDKDGGRPMTPSEVLNMLTDVIGQETMKSDKHAVIASNELKSFDQSGTKKEDPKKSFDMEKFHSFMKNHPIVLFPAFRIQEILRRKVVGLMFWQKQIDRRVKMTQEKVVDEYMSVAQILDQFKTGLHISHDKLTSGSRSRSNSSAGSSSHRRRGSSRIYADTTAPESPSPSDNISNSNSRTSGGRVSIPHGLKAISVKQIPGYDEDPSRSSPSHVGGSVGAITPIMGSPVAVASNKGKKFYKPGEAPTASVITSTTSRKSSVHTLPAQ